MRIGGIELKYSGGPRVWGGVRSTREILVKKLVERQTICSLQRPLALNRVLSLVNKLAILFGRKHVVLKELLV